jgi:hypothetical protein
LLLAADGLFAAHSQCGMIEPKRMTDQEARVKFRGVDAARTKFRCAHAPQIGNRRCSRGGCGSSGNL